MRLCVGLVPLRGPSGPAHAHVGACLGYGQLVSTGPRWMCWWQRAGELLRDLWIPCHPRCGLVSPGGACGAVCAPGRCLCRVAASGQCMRRRISHTPSSLAITSSSILRALVPCADPELDRSARQRCLCCAWARPCPAKRPGGARMGCVVRHSHGRKAPIAQPASYAPAPCRALSSSVEPCRAVSSAADWASLFEPHAGPSSSMCALWIAPDPKCSLDLSRTRLWLVRPVGDPSRTGHGLVLDSERCIAIQRTLGASIPTLSSGRVDIAAWRWPTSLAAAYTTPRTGARLSVERD